MSALAISKEELAWNPVEGMARYAKARNAVFNSQPRPKPSEDKPAPAIVVPQPKKQLPVVIMINPVTRIARQHTPAPLTTEQHWQAFERAEMTAAQEEIAFRPDPSCEEQEITGNVEWRPGEGIARLKVEQIIRFVALACSVSREDILSVRRTRQIVRPRQLAMYLARKYTLRSLPEIGRKFGGKDHTTVLHACRVIESMIASGEVIEPTRQEIFAAIASFRGSSATYACMR